MTKAAPTGAVIAQAETTLRAAVNRRWLVKDLPKRTAARLSLAVVVSIVFCFLTSAQNIQFTKGAIGSGLDNTLSIPIRSYPGRGGASLSVNLFYSSKVLRLKYLHTPGRLVERTTLLR
jgi:hypothetical protein